MTFFYELNKRLADLATKQTLAEDKGAKPDFLDLDKDGNKKESMKKATTDKGSTKSGKMFGKKADMDESAFQAAIGKKKYGADGMKALQKAGRENASNNTMDTIRNRYDKYDEGMTDDTHKETKLIRDLRAQGLSDKQIVRKMEQIKRGTTKTVAKEGDMEEGNEFSGELAQARASGAKEFNVDGKSYPVKEAGAPMTPKQKSFAKLAPPANKITFADKIAGAKKEVDEMLGDVAAEAIKKAVKKSEPRSKGTAFDPEVAKTMISKDEHPRYDVKDTGYSKRFTRKTEEPKDDDDSKDAQADKYAGPKKKGRPAGTKRAIGAKGPTGKSKLMSKDSIKEMDSVSLTDKGEYDQEGDMAKDQLHTLAKAAQELDSILGDDQNLPEWVQSKITKALDYINAVNDYMDQERHDSSKTEPVAEKAVSKKQQKFMGMVHAAQKGEKPASGAVAKVAKEMPKKDAKDFAATKHKGLPEKVKAKKEESVEETADAPKEKKSSGGYNFGSGVYESLDRKFRQALTEGMNVSVNMSTGQDGQPTKSINISADGEDADRLAELLKMAGLGGQDSACNTCGSTPCGCESLDENSPDWPTNTETSDNAMQYSGGLNGPKSTGQTTTPVIASQLRRQVSMEEGVKIERSLFKLYNQYKLKWKP